MSRVAFDAYLARIRTAGSTEALGSISRAVTDDRDLEGYERMNLWDAAARRGKELEPAPFKPAVDVDHVDVEIPPDLASSELVAPVTTPEIAKMAWAAYKAMAQALQEPGDVVEISGKPFRRKSFWRKVGLAYGLSLELRQQQLMAAQDADGVRVAWYVQVRAIAKSGRYADGVGSCSNREPSKKEALEHVLLATAYTRAANRAIADLVAAGEVSAEEVE